MQIASACEVGWYAAEAFDRPGQFIGQSIEIADDGVTRHEAATTLHRTGHRPEVSFTIPSVCEPKCLKISVDVEWIAREGFNIDIVAARRIHPGLLTLAA